MTQREGRPVVVAIPTYRRRELLPELVALVSAQLLEMAGPSRLVVIDNDPDLSARETAHALGAEYVSEPRPGIAAVRQRALDTARDDELLIMIDDDTLPEDGWARQLVSSWVETGAAVVVGWVRYVWSADTDPWIAVGGFMRRTRHPRHAPLNDLATGNVLVDVTQIRRLRVAFDLSLGLLGGEDLTFGRDVVLAGGAVIACPDSVVRDEVPAERCTRAFVHRRAVGHGRTRTRVELRGHRGVNRMLKRVQLLVGGAARVVVFELFRLGAWLRNDTRSHASATRRAWFARGRVGGVLGWETREYLR